MDGRQSGEMDAVVQYVFRRRRDIDKSQRGAGQNVDVTTSSKNVHLGELQPVGLEIGCDP